MGLTLTQFYIENISLPPEVEQALDTRTKMGVLGNLQQYTQFQTAEAIRDAAKNPGGIAGAGAGLGAGVAIGQQMAGAMSGAAQRGAVPPPMPMQTLVGYYIGTGGKQTGPFDIDALGEKVRGGAITRQTLVWKPGMAGWTAADGVDELRSLFASMPPPLPT